MTFLTERGAGLRSMLTLMREAGIARMTYYPETGCAALGNNVDGFDYDYPAIAADPVRRAALQARIAEIEHAKPIKRKKDPKRGSR